MNILPVSHNYTNFRANSRWVCDRCGHPLYKTTTYFFRDDINWKDLVRFLANKYSSADKVNILNHACSNGMEPYSLVMQMLRTIPKSAEKFFPIIAKDLDKDNIIAAKNGSCGASISDKERAQWFLDYRLWDYVNWQSSNNPNNDMVLVPKQFVKDKVEFSQGNILNDLENLPKSNNVVLCRNMFIYLEPQEQDNLIKKLAQKLDNSSTLIIGNYDFPSINEKLCENGFKQTHINYVFEKVR